MVDDMSDSLIRQAAFRHVRLLSQLNDQLSAADLAQGFDYEGERIPLVNPQRGIFKPRRMRWLLSIKTVFPKPGGRVWYDDQRHVHRQIFDGEEAVDYAFMGDDPAAADNRWLREAHERQVPIIYFLGVSPGRYEAVFPTFIHRWLPDQRKVQVSFGPADERRVSEPASVLERRYALRHVQQRLHQASFRQAVITAYGGRCALSGLPEPLLLDAAHIVDDRHERLGQPIITNGLPLSKIHHAAFDAHLIGIDADARLHVARRLMLQRDGPMLEALKTLDGQRMHLPRRPQDRPDRDRLDLRFREFLAAA